MNRGLPKSVERTGMRPFGGVSIPTSVADHPRRSPRSFGSSTVAMQDTLKKPHSFLLPALAVLGLAAGHVGAQDAARENRTATIEYIAHACFRVTSPAGKQVLIDPYASRVWLGYDFPPGVRADAVLISHPHYDHDGGEAMKRPVPWAPETLVLRR